MTTRVENAQNYDNWLESRGFDLTEPQEIFRAIYSILKRTPLSEPDYWKHHSLVFAEGKIHLVEDKGDDLEIIGEAASRAFSNPSLTFEDKIDLAKKMKEMFRAHGQHFNEPSIHLKIGEELIILPLSDCANSFILDKFWTSDYFDARKAQEDGKINVILPFGLTAEDFQNYIHLEVLTLDTAFSILILSDYLQDIKTGQLAIDFLLLNLPSSSEELEDLMITNSIMSADLRTRYMSALMNKYIRTSLEQGSTLHNIAETLLRSPELRKAIIITSFDLDLRNLQLKPDDLIHLAAAIPNVRSLNIASTTIEQLPECWIHSLENLDISGTKICSLPTGFFSLKTFKSDTAKQLMDISALNGSPNLEVISIRFNCVTKAPTHCLKLKKFDARFASLNDISGLDGSPSLEEIDISQTPISRAPIGCLALKKFVALQAYSLNDISGLDESQTLEEITISYALVNHAPRNCLALKSFTISHSSHLNDISQLDGSEKLELISILHTTVTRAPYDCPALVKFRGAYNPTLTDISGLNSSPNLKEVWITSTAITSIPENIRHTVINS